MTFTTDQYKTADGKYAKLFYIQLNKLNFNIGFNNHIIFEVIEMNDINGGDNFNYALYYANFGYNDTENKSLCKIYCINKSINNNVEVLGEIKNDVVTIYGKATRQGRPLTINILYNQNAGFINIVYRDKFINDITGTIVNQIIKYLNVDEVEKGTITYEEGITRTIGNKESLTKKDGYAFVSLAVDGNFTNDKKICTISFPPNNTVTELGYAYSSEGWKVCRIKIYNSGSISCYDVPTNCTKLTLNTSYYIN